MFSTSNILLRDKPREGQIAPPQKTQQNNNNFTMIDDGWEYPTSEAYQPYMVELMEFFHGGVDYASNQTFTREELLELGPLDIKRWLANKAFGDPDYNVNQGDRPIYARSSTLAFAKKAISFFMPNHLPPWANGAGNPTKSSVVNNLLREVKQFEVRGEGVGDQSMRPINEREFRMTIELFRTQNDWTTKWKYPAMALWQYHLIGRIDDVVHFKLDDLKGHALFQFALQTKVRWSKNVMEERTCPDQILLGSMDPTFCILATLGVYLESFLCNYPQSRYLFISHETNTGPKNLIQAYRSKLDTVVFKNPAFSALSLNDSRGVGTHSYRKYASQYAIDKGASADDVEIRGRWKKRGGRVVFRYIDPGQLYTDAKVESLLCVGGPVKYQLRQGLPITNEWLFEHVVPNIYRRYSNDLNLCKMFALAVLFAALDEASEVPIAIREQVTVAYATLGADEIQPVIKVPLHVYRIEDRLTIDEIRQEENNGAPMVNGGLLVNAGPGLLNVGPSILHHQQALLVKLDRLERHCNDQYRQLHALIERNERILVNQFQTMNNNIRRFGGTVEGAFVVQRGAGHARNDGVGNRNEPQSLAHNPRTLMELWREWKHGIDGRKPAEQFTMAERNSRVGGVKQKWYRRSVVWKCMDRLVRSGDTPQVAANKIRQAYGYTLSVTQIINQMIHDKQTGGHPNLR